MSKFCFLDFQFIYLNILLQTSVIFVSNNQQVLSFALGIFSQLLTPLVWRFSVVFKMTKDMIDLMLSPVPIMMGINKDCSKMLKEILPQKLPFIKGPTLFVLMDEEVSLLSHHIDYQKIHIPLFGLQNQGIKKLYQKMYGKNNSKQLSIDVHDNEKSFSVLFKSKGGKSTTERMKELQEKKTSFLGFGKSKQETKSTTLEQKVELLRLIRNTIETTFSVIKKHPFVEVHKMDLKKLNEQKFFDCVQDDNFVKEVIRTQSFNSFMEENQGYFN